MLLFSIFKSVQTARSSLSTRALHGPGSPRLPLLRWTLVAAPRAHSHYRHHPVSMACVTVTVLLLLGAGWDASSLSSASAPPQLYDTSPSTSRLSRYRGHGVSGRSNRNCAGPQPHPRRLSNADFIGDSMTVSATAADWLSAPSGRSVPLDTPCPNAVLRCR